MDEKFRKKFPNLAKELEEKKVCLTLKFDPSFHKEKPEKKYHDPLRGFEPTAEDFIRRCGNIKEATEIIAFLEGRGEISAEKAENLRRKLESQGLTSFGDKKEWGYYSRMAR
ncbi:MAG: DUF2095 family protein [Candidatus Ranarchaeia archaeon]